GPSATDSGRPCRFADRGSQQGRRSDPSPRRRQAIGPPVKGKDTASCTDLVTLRPFEPADLALLAAWLRQPHGAPWDPRPEHDLERAASPPPGGSQAVVVAGATAVGYLRWQRVDRETLDSLGLPEIPANTVDADIVMSADAVGRELGPAALRALAEEIRR